MTAAYVIRDELTPINHRAGRQQSIDAIVIHVMEGTLASARSWFRDPISVVSSHYGIGLRGEIERYVSEGDTAFANGRVYNATAALVRERPGVNPNDYTISIEHEGDGKSDMPPAQRAASVWLIREIVTRRPAIKVDRRHIIRHNEIYARKTCPGAIDVDRLVAEVAAGGVVSNVPERPRVVWSGYAGDWLIVTRFVSDTEWYFIPSRELRATVKGMRATSKLSEMPLQPST